VLDSTLTPSARTVRELQSSNQSFADFALNISVVHKSYFLDLHAANEARLEEFRQEAGRSLEEQQDIEVADKVDFDTYLARYFS
jgi:glutamate--cysteine ligase